MWVLQVTAAATIIAVSVAGTGGVALILSALDVLSRPSGEQMSCPICSGATRFHKAYLMCDECKSFAGLAARITRRAKHSDKARPSTTNDSVSITHPRIGERA
jgi:hypothetical protein